MFVHLQEPWVIWLSSCVAFISTSFGNWENHFYSAHLENDKSPSQYNLQGNNHSEDLDRQDSAFLI